MAQATIPELERNCGSWIVVDRASRKPVIELFNRRSVENVAAFNSDQYEIYTALSWLQKFNSQIAR